MWFGEFIHGVMETAYRLWLDNPLPFPWPCTPTVFNAAPPPNRPAHDIGSIGDLVEASLAAAGKSPRSGDLRQSGYLRAEHAVNEIGPELFPLIRSAEEKVIGTRPLVIPAGQSARSQMYELHGVMDVVSSAALANHPNNVLTNAVQAVVHSVPTGAEIIVDYKGSRRPATNHVHWALGDWQLQTYAWLRSRQFGAAPVVAGVLLYVNELAPGTSDIAALQREIRRGNADVAPVPGSADDYQLRTWTAGAAAPQFSAAFRMQRMIRVVQIDPNSINTALAHFDQVVVDIEACVAQEAQHGNIITHWPACGDDGTCDACDFRHFCPAPANRRQTPGYVPPAPQTP